MLIFLEFEIEGLSIEEPENGQPVTTNITIIRTGGSLGVVTITWTALLNGKYSCDLEQN